MINADEVYFLFMNKDSIAHFKEDGGKLHYKYHGHIGFNVAIPPGLNAHEELSWTIEP